MTSSNAKEPSATSGTKVTSLISWDSLFSLLSQEPSLLFQIGKKIKKGETIINC